MMSVELDQELSAHIVSLEQALTVIASTKRNLANNAAQAKSRIHCVMSRQLELVRSREVWLLGQVELLHDTKDTVLREQADSLRHALGALQACRQYMEDAAATQDTGNLEKTIQETIDRLSKMDLEPLENRNLSFKAELSKMREAILCFGKVDGQPVLPAACDLGFDHSHVSRSLPRAFEEYDEDEDSSNLMYKTVQDVSKQGNTTQRMVNVTVPKLKAKPSDWLFLPTDVQPPTPMRKSASSSLTLPVFKSDLSEWLCRRQQNGGAESGNGDGGSSVQQWLHEIQTHSDLEEEDITAMVARQGIQAHVAKAGSTLSSIDVISMPSESVTPSAMTPVSQDTSSYFNQVAAAPKDDWLKTAETNGSTATYETMKYFKEMANSSKEWVQKHQKEDKVSSPGCCKGSVVSLCPPLSSPDIEDLDTVACTPGETAEDATEKDVDEREVAVFNNINQLCRANETCHTFTDCVCDDNCMEDTEDPSKKSPVKAWLSRPSTMEKLKDTPIFEYFNLVSGSNDDGWLNETSRDVDAVEAPKNGALFPPFQKQSSTSVWLLESASKVPTPSVSSSNCPFARLSASQPSEWLSTQAVVAEPITKSESSHPAYRFNASTEQWLASPSKPVPKVNQWLLSSPVKPQQQQQEIRSPKEKPSINATDSCKDLKQYLNQVKPEYSWSLCSEPNTRSCTSTSVKLDDKPLSKNLELPESDNKNIETAKWLLVMKGKEDAIQTKEIDTTDEEAASTFSAYVHKNKAALVGEWLMNIHNDF